MTDAVKYELSPIEKFDLSSIKAKSSLSPLTTKLFALEVGDCFTIKGRERNDLTSRFRTIKGRKFKTIKTGDTLTYTIVRTE